MTTKPFTKLIFQGARFTQARMPLEVLPELAAYRDLLLAVARFVYLTRHPHRQRLPKGFESALQLVLDKVEDGSVAPVVSRTIQEPPLALFDEAPEGDVFEEARDILARTIEAGSTDRGFPELSPDLFARFSTFGRTLRDDECIVVASPDTRTGPVYDRMVRRRLVLYAHQSYEDEVDLVGEVRGADKDTEGFSLRLADGRKIQVRTPPLFLPIAFRSLGESVLVHVRGSGLFDAGGSLQRVVMATDVRLAEEGEEGIGHGGCPTMIDDQVKALRLLPPGWFDESSRAFQAEALEWAAKLLRGLVEAFQLPNPHLYPTPEGNIRAEWSTPSWEVNLELSPASKRAEALATRIDSDEVREYPVATAEPGAESRLGKFLSEYLH